MRSNFQKSNVHDAHFKSTRQQFFRKSSQLNTLPIAKSRTRSKQNKNMHKCSSVYSERGVLLPFNFVAIQGADFFLSLYFSLSLLFFRPLAIAVDRSHQFRALLQEQILAPGPMS